MSSINLLLLLTVIVMLCHVTIVTSQCSPRSNYKWTKRGDTWYTETKIKGGWMKMVYLCADLERPYTNLAHVHTDQDEEHLKIKGLENGPHWIGGSRLGRRRQWVWFMFKDMTRRSVTPVKKFYWAPGEPRAGMDCMSYDATKREWTAEWCSKELHGLCQFKCE